jgi:hypothetical protein
LIELPFICSRGEIAQPCLPPLPVIEDLYVLTNLPDGLPSRPIAMVMDKLILERTPEALQGSVITRRGYTKFLLVETIAVLYLRSRFD